MSQLFVNNVENNMYMIGNALLNYYNKFLISYLLQQLQSSTPLLPQTTSAIKWPRSWFTLRKSWQLSPTFPTLTSPPNRRERPCIQLLPPRSRQFKAVPSNNSPTRANRGRQGGWFLAPNFRELSGGKAPVLRLCF